MSTERESIGGAVLVDPLGGLQLDPSNELRFKGPFDDYVTVSLSIKNPTQKRIAFKIKTTAPKRYCVKPNSGVLDQNQSMKVNVLLQPFNYDPNEKNKHKFMVQYLYLNDEEMQMSVNDILNMWKDVSPSRLLDIKLKCLFEFNESEQQKIAQHQQQNEISSNYASVDSKQQQQQQTPKLVNQTKATPAISKENNRVSSATLNDVYSNAPETHPNDFDSSSLNLNTNKSNSTNNNNNNNEIKPSNIGARLEKNDNVINDLKQENESLKKEIRSLKDEVVRLRGLALSSSSGSSTTNGSLADLLNNRLMIAIIILVAIIFYLLLFR